jgi:hypothetical protein
MVASTTSIRDLPLGEGRARATIGANYMIAPPFSAEVSAGKYNANGDEMIILL